MGYIAQACRDHGFALQAITPRGLHKTAIRHGDLLYVSGQVSRLDNEAITGPATEGDIERCQVAARTAALRALSIIDAILTPGERIRILKLTGYLMSGAGFGQHSKVLDGASELLVTVLGEDGAHARTAIGVASLPGSGMVELDLLCALERHGASAA